MRFGVLTLPRGPWDDLVRDWRRLDDLGFDAIYVADALAHPGNIDERWFDAWICLATLAQMTQRPRIGTLVTPITFRNPAAVVNAAVTVDLASGGRFVLALGAGEPGPDHELAGVPALSSAERRDAFGAYVRRVRELLELDPRGRSIPLTVAAQAPGTIGIAAELADTWNTFGGRGLSSVEGRALLRGRRAALAESIRMSVLLGYAFIAEQPFRSREAFAEVVESYRDIGVDELVFYWPPERNAPPGEAVDRAVYERIVRESMPGFRS